MVRDETLVLRGSIFEDGYWVVFETLNFFSITYELSLNNYININSKSYSSS